MYVFLSVASSTEMTSNDIFKVDANLVPSQLDCTTTKAQHFPEFYQ